MELWAEEERQEYNMVILEFTVVMLYIVLFAYSIADYMQQYRWCFKQAEEVRQASVTTDVVYFGVREHAASILVEEPSYTQPIRCLDERYSGEEQPVATPNLTQS